MNVVLTNNAYGNDLIPRHENDILSEVTDNESIHNYMDTTRITQRLITFYVQTTTRSRHMIRNNMIDVLTTVVDTSIWDQFEVFSRPHTAELRLFARLENSTTSIGVISARTPEPRSIYQVEVCLVYM